MMKTLLNIHTAVSICTGHQETIPDINIFLNPGLATLNTNYKVIEMIIANFFFSKFFFPMYYLNKKLKHKRVIGVS